MARVRSEVRIAKPATARVMTLRAPVTAKVRSKTWREKALSADWSMMLSGSRPKSRGVRREGGGLVGRQAEAVAEAVDVREGLGQAGGGDEDLARAGCRSRSRRRRRWRGLRGERDRVAGGEVLAAGELFVDHRGLARGDAVPGVGEGVEEGPVLGGRWGGRRRRRARPGRRGSRCRRARWAGSRRCGVRGRRGGRGPPRACEAVT